MTPVTRPPEPSVDSPDIARAGTQCDGLRQVHPAHGVSLFARFRRKPAQYSTGFRGRREMSDARPADRSTDDTAGRHRGPASPDEADTQPHGKHRRQSED